MRRAQFLVQIDGVTEVGQPAFWMRYGTAHIDGKPFIGSASPWRDQVVRDVPDVVDGAWQHVKLCMKQRCFSVGCAALPLVGATRSAYFVQPLPNQNPGL